MHAPSTTELLRVWEEGSVRSPERRSLLLLASACEELSPEQLVGLSAGQRDARLLALREELFGAQLACLDTCPGCGEHVEVQLTVGDLRRESAPTRPATLSLARDETEILFRLPTCRDLLRIDRTHTPEAHRRQLLDTCILEIRRPGGNGSAACAHELDEAAADAIEAAMAEADPQADVDLDLRCPECGHAWHTPFDIGAFLWTEIHHWARRLLRDVHRLASAYGWCESDILALSAPRRQAYLDLIAP